MSASKPHNHANDQDQDKNLLKTALNPTKYDISYIVNSAI